MAFNLRKPPKLTPKLDAYPYQIDAVRAVKSLSYAAIFHEQGLGKTKIAVDLLLHWLEADVIDTVFVITKKILVQNWFEEVVAHSHITPKILSGNRRENSIALNSPILIYITNYELVSANFELLRLFLDTCRVGAILDESQKIKNPEARITKDFLTIADGFTRRVIMTGTPVANRPYDIWSQIRFLDDGKALGGSFAEFENDFDLPKTQYAGHEYADRLSGILEKLKPFSIRETKRTAGLELPDKTILTHPVEMEPRQAAIYEAYRDTLAHEFVIDGEVVIDEAESILKQLLRLVQCASNPALVDKTYKSNPGKCTKLFELFQEIDVLSSGKAIVWTSFIANVEWLSDKLQHYNPQKLHGSMTIAERNKAVRKFKTDNDNRILIATPGAAKEGLTLTVANHAVFFDRSFSLDDYLQAQDRIHRISQTDDCFVHNLTASNTIDEWVDTLLNAKHQAAQLAQGDISRSEFAQTFNIDLAGELKRILAPRKYKHNFQGIKTT